MWDNDARCTFGIDTTRTDPKAAAANKRTNIELELLSYPSITLPVVT